MWSVLLQVESREGQTAVHEAAESSVFGALDEA